MGEQSSFALLNTTAFVLCALFLGYVTLLALVYLRSDEGEEGDADAFGWHVFVPCLDEADVVGTTIARLLDLHPALHVWCIDDASSDTTRATIERVAASEPRVHLVARDLPAAQQGKGAALNAAWRALSAWLPPDADRHRTIVAVVDADGELDARSLALVAGPGGFAEESVGAVQVAVRIANRSTGDRPAPQRWGQRLLVDLQDLEFIGPIAAMQLLRGRTRSVSMGGNGQFSRLAVLDEIAARASVDQLRMQLERLLGIDLPAEAFTGTPWHGALLEDFELGLHVLLAGHQTRYLHETSVRQEGLPTLRLLVRQRSRWAQGAMQCGRYLGDILRSPHLTNRSAFEISYFLLLPWLQLLGFFVYLAAYVVLVGYLVSAPGGLSGLWASGQWGVVPLLVLFGVGPFAMWGPLYRRGAEPSITRRRALVLGVGNWLYSNLHYVATWWAFARLLRSRDDWKKTARVIASPDQAEVPRSDGAPTSATDAADPKVSAFAGRGGPRAARPPRPDRSAPTAARTPAARWTSRTRRPAG